jgi:aminoglycoside 3-N-acetyltransferase I
VNFAVQRLDAADTDRMRELNQLFARVFMEPDSYKPEPSETYLARALARTDIIVLVAMADGNVVGGLVAYLLEKLEQERSEIYIYDLAVAEHCRRSGVATALIGEVQAIADRVGAWVIYVQADYVDAPAVALYDKLGTREEVLHFDIPPATPR